MANVISWQTTIGSMLSCIIGIGTALAADDVEKNAKRAAQATERQAVSRADAEFKAAKEVCNAREGNDRAVCMKEASADHRTAKAAAKAERKASVSRAEVAGERRKGDYEVARKRCAELAGNERNDCEDRARQILRK